VEAIDTNVLIRYITGDHAGQLKKATQLIESGEPMLVNPIVLVELTWVLSSVYSLSRKVIAETLKDIGSCGFFLFKKPKPVNAAIDCFSNGYDLADAMILNINSEDGAAATYTFDKKAARLAGYVLL
jgi:predicted nucleic-acid-binding protein